ncbi:hypothetical protein Ndes2526B_g03482 [Nannochloris sp. 'desiccata']|nr:hypothetical protein KSW81_001184 [Chlorella desiccata (nom. nud.)]KAH7622649.1 hypothetical protein NADE_005231 [Chlorella desiccata (nom. nud.)]
MVRKIKDTAKKALNKIKRKKAEEGDGSQTPARLQRKLLKKVAFLEKLTANKPAKSTSAGVQKKKKRRPSIALSNFGSLAQSLKEAAKKAEGSLSKKLPGASVGTLKARSRIANEESERLQQVLQHPTFQADPLAAIATHLEATMPPPPPPPKLSMDAKQKKHQKKLKKLKLKAEQQGDDMVG